MDQKGEKLYCVLAAIVKCPICNEKMTGNIYICGSGHSICCGCINAGTFCTRCQAPYTKIPNLVVQNLLSQFDDIKECLMELDDLRMKSRELSIAVGKKENDDQLSETKDEHIPGHYHCWITNECKFVGYISSIVKHFKNTHPFEFKEISIGNLPYTQTWEMDYSIGNCVSCAIKIGKLLFIIHISINDKGELGSCILMYANHSIAYQHVCKMEIECDNGKKCYTNAKVISAQTSERVILRYKRSGLQIHRNQMLYCAIQAIKRFKCTLILEKKERAVVNNKLSKTFINKNDNFDVDECKNKPPSSMGFESTNELSANSNYSVQPHTSVVTKKKQFDCLNKKEESIQKPIIDIKKIKPLKIPTVSPIDKKLNIAGNKFAQLDIDKLYEKSMCAQQSKADSQKENDRKNQLVAMAAERVKQRMREESTRVRGSVQSGFIHRKTLQTSPRKTCERVYDQPQLIVHEYSELTTDNHDEYSNQSKIDAVTNKQLIKLENEVDQLSISDESNSKNKFEEPSREANKFTGTPGVIDKQSYTYDQSPRQNQLYPNLEMYANAQCIPTNCMTPPAQPMNDNHFNGENMPSAPYERVPPRNPYFHQQHVNSVDNAKLTQEKEKHDKCIVS